MPKLDRFEVEFDNPMAVYYAGTGVKGRVVIVLNQPMEMRGVRLFFSGKAHTHWTESRRSGDRTVTDHYNGHECYFEHEITVWGNQRGADVSKHPIMPAGTHAFDFTYPLPPTCPSSFEGSYGWIRYLVECKIDRPWKFDHKTKRPFTLLGMIDLNADPMAAQPLANSGEKTIGCMCCTAGQVTCQVHMPRRGYVSGEVVAVNADVSNNSSRTLDRVSMRLIQTIVFRASHGGSTHTKSSEVILAEAVKSDPVGRGDSQNWTNEGLRLPPVPLTLSGCSILNITYVVEFKITPGGMSFSFTVVLPFVVGSVPLRQQMQHFQQTFRQFSIDHGGSTDPYAGLPPSYPGGDMQPSAPPGNDVYPDLPPPTYAEATTGKVNIKDDTDNEHTRGQLEFAPRYAYYDWASAPADQPPTQSLAYNDPR